MGAVLGVALLLLSSNAHGGRALHAEPMFGEKIRIDGVIREWPGKLTELGDTLKGNASGGDPRVSGGVGYDDTQLYVVLKVFDDKIVRTKAAGDGEDHATLSIAFPKAHGGGFTTREIDLFPGDPGRVAGVVKIGGSTVGSAKIVESPVKGGLEVEALIPWSALPEARTVRVGLRGALSYTDADSRGSIKAVVATGGGQGGSLPALRLEAEQALDASLIRDKGLSDRPVRVAYGDVAGDSMIERVAVYDNYLTITGPHYRQGKEFYFGELGISSGKMVTRLELSDGDGDGKDEIFIQKRLGGPDRYREILTVLKIGNDEAPWLAFVHEVAIKTPDLLIANEVKLKKGPKGVDIEIAQGQADDVDPSTYAEPMPSDMPSTLLPWQTIGSRTFRWDGKTYSKVDEKAWTPKLKQGEKASVAKHKAQKSSNEPPAPPPPRPPTPDELLDRLYANYRKERAHGAAQRPRFDFVTDVAGDQQPERVVIHGKDLVVFGKGYKGGTSYAFITIGVADPKDVVDATARDLTGDGKAEIVVRAVLHAKASKELGGDVVERQALFVYRVTDAGIGRVFAAETGRSIGDKSVIGAVALEPAKHGTAIELRAGRAINWTEQTYPFPTDRTAAGGLEPLLLPWGDTAKRRYKFDGSAYVAE